MSDRRPSRLTPVRPVYWLADHAEGVASGIRLRMQATNETELTTILASLESLICTLTQKDRVKLMCQFMCIAEQLAAHMRGHRPVEASLCGVVARWTWLQLATSSLSRRERQVLALLQQGLSEKQIARRLDVSSETIHVYVKSLYRNFNVDSRSGLLSLWLEAFANDVMVVAATPMRAATDTPCTSSTAPVNAGLSEQTVIGTSPPQSLVQRQRQQRLAAAEKNVQSQRRVS